MLFTTQNQFIYFFIFFVSGFIFGLFFNIKNIIKIKNENSFLRHIIDFFGIFAFLIVFWFINLKINYGKLRLYAIFSYFFAFFLSNFIIKKFVAKAISKCYNRLRKRKDEKQKHVEEV